MLTKISATLKSIFSTCFFLATTIPIQAQVGIGTSSPASSAQLDISSTTKGFLPPRMTTAQRNNISNPANGLIIFNTTSNSLNVFLLGNWYQLSATLPSGSIGSLSVGSASNTGTLHTGYAASGVSSVISYTGGNGETHSGQTVTSTGVTGFTATLASGNFAVGGGTLTYTITGTGTSAGTANFALDIGGQNATLSIEVVTLAPGVSYQGGKVAYVLQSGDPGYDPATPHGLIAANSDQSTGIAWGPNNTATGATAIDIGTGLANTNTIIASQGGSATNYAANLARTYNGGGYTDWYLPSKNELQKLYDNRIALGNNFSTTNRYHSSSEAVRFAGDTWAAWQFSFVDNTWAEWDKANTFNVRAIRSF